MVLREAARRLFHREGPIILVSIRSVLGLVLLLLENVLKAENMAPSMWRHTILIPNITHVSDKYYM